MIDIRLLAANAALCCLGLAVVPAAADQPASSDQLARGGESPVDGITPASRGAVEPVAQTPASPPRPAFEPVTVQRPSVRVPATPDVSAAETAARIDGVNHATAIRSGRIQVGAGAAGPMITVAAVDPVAFRPLTPQVTADELALWDRLVEGEAVVLHQVASDLNLTLGEDVLLGGATALPVRVGALATNGIPPVADVIVNRETGRRLGLDAVQPTVLVAVGEDHDPKDVAARLTEELAAEAEVIPDPRQRTASAPPPAPGGASVWDRLAYCESGGNWHIDTGNGFYGGLQFLPESWHWVGGQGMPHEASRETQIAMAERLLALQGWRAWPVCSVKLGLREPSPDDPLDVSLGLA